MNITEKLTDYFLRILFVLAVWSVSLNSYANVELYDPSKDLAYTFEHAESKWLRYNQELIARLFRSAVGRESKEFDILVLPFQVRDHAIDLVGRSLMSRYLISELHQSNQYKIPNLDLVERAIGEHRRRFDVKEIIDLAQITRVNKFVVGYVGHDNKGKMSFTIRVYSRKNNKEKFNELQFSQMDWRKLEFNDVNLPSQVFRSYLHEMVEFITGKTTDTAKPELQTQKLSSTFNQNIAGLVTHASKLTAIETAYYLQLLGILHPDPSERRRERLFERSLVALSLTSIRSEYYKELKARAYYYLYRRPAGLAVLKNSIRKPVNNSISAILNGDLLSLLSNSKKIKNTKMRLLSQLEAKLLYQRYNQTFDNSINIDARNLGKDWQYFINNRLEGLNNRGANSNLRIKTILDDVYPVLGQSAKIQVRGKIAEGDFDIESGFELSVIDHIHKLITRNPKIWCCIGGASSISKWDYLDLIDGVGEANLINFLKIITHNKGLYSKGISELNKMKVVYDGHPKFMEISLFAKSNLARQATGLEQKMLNEEIIKDSHNLFMWTNGQRFENNQLSHILNWYADDFVNVETEVTRRTKSLKPLALKVFYATDYPQRSNRRLLPYIDEKIKLKLLSHQIDFATHQFGAVNEYYKEAGQNSDKMIADRIKSRFIGNHDRVELIAGIKRRRGDRQGEIDVYKLSIETNSTFWKPYIESAKYYIENEDYRSAEKVLSKYPLFLAKYNYDLEVVSHYAWEAGNLFFMRGYIESARKFYTKTSYTGSGSDSYYDALTKLAIIEENYSKAIQYALQRIRRYNVPYAYKDYMSLLHAIGDGKTAWNTFESIVNTKNDSNIWKAAFVGLRIENRSVDELVEWLSQPQFKNIDDGFVTIPERFSFMLFSVDRRADEINKKAFLKVWNNNTVKSRELLMYFALKNNNSEEAILHAIMVPIFRWEYQSEFGHLIPYKVWARLKHDYNPHINKDSARLIKELKLAEHNLKVHEQKTDRTDNYGRFNMYLTKAIVAAHNKKIKLAKINMNNAFLYLPVTEKQFNFSMYQLLEISEWMFKEFKDNDFIHMGLGWASVFQKAQPMYSWLYSFEAKYAKDVKKANRALALALYLDPKSAWVSDISNDKKQRAKIWLESNNPFTVEKIKQKQKAL